MTIVKKFKLVLWMIFSFSVIFFSIYAYKQSELERNIQHFENLSIVTEKVLQIVPLFANAAIYLDDVYEHKKNKSQEQFDRYISSINDITGFIRRQPTASEAYQGISSYLTDVDGLIQKIKKTKDHYTEEGITEVYEKIALLNDRSIDNYTSAFNARRQVADIIHLHTIHLAIFAWTLFFLSCVLLIVAYVCLRRYLTNPIQNLTSDIGGLAKGDLNLNIQGFDRTDEIGDIARALDVIRTRSIEILQLRKAVNTVSVGVLTVNNKGLIVYHNQTIVDLVQKHLPDIQKQYPGFDPHQLIDKDVNFLKPNDSSQRLCLVKERYQTQLRLGDCIFDVISHPTFNELGDRLGAVIEVRDVSDEVRVELEIGYMVGAAVQGNMSIRLDEENKVGFMRQLSTSMNHLMNNIERAINDIGSMFSALATGDFTARMDSNYQGVFATLQKDANTMAHNLSQIITDIMSSSEQVYSAVAEISVGSQDLSGRTERQSASLKETAASMEHLALTVRHNSQNAERASKLAADSCHVAQQGGSVVKDAVQAMNRISTSSEKISEIVTVIDDIASQTELLALNAAVEAARAGEAGKGFSVVAENVSKLANRSAMALQQIKMLITESANHVNTGVQLVNLTGTSLAEILNAATSVAELVKDIAKASADQSAGIEEVNHAVGAMDDMTQKNAVLVEESLSTAMGLQEQADRLTRLMQEFKV